MITFAENVIAYTIGLNQERFVACRLNYDSTLRNLELIGEAATHVPEAVRVAYPDVPWRMVIATRPTAPAAAWRAAQRPSDPTS